MQLPVKDTTTIPWMSRREIPAVKAALSAWRHERKKREFSVQIGGYVRNHIHDFQVAAGLSASTAAYHLETITAIDELMRKEQGKGREAKNV